MYAMFAPELVDIHVDEGYREKIRQDAVRNLVFDILTLGVNVLSLECYNWIAKVIAETDHPETITAQEVIELAGDIEDETGYLV